MGEPKFDPQILNKLYNHNVPKKKEKESSLKSIYYAS